MMKFIYLFTLSVALFFSALSSTLAQTPSSELNDSKPPEAAAQQGWFGKTYDEAITKFDSFYDQDRLNMILSGEAHHGRGTYTPERIDQLTEKVWGLGFDKGLRDEKDNEESIQFLVVADSHYKPQLSATYSYQWMKSLGGDWEAGIGYAVGLFSRSDIFSSKPFPGGLPLLTLGTRDTKLLVNYLPRLSGTGNGDVLILTLRVNLR